jgi:hypothetical protein
VLPFNGIGHGYTVSDDEREAIALTERDEALAVLRIVYDVHEHEEIAPTDAEIALAVAQLHRVRELGAKTSEPDATSDGIVLTDIEKAAGAIILVAEGYQPPTPPKPKPKKRRFSRKQYVQVIVEALKQQPRSVEAVLAIIEEVHPGIIRRPPYLVHDIKVAMCARRLHALRAGPGEVLTALERF